MENIVFEARSKNFEELADLANAQWICIRQLADRYSEKKIPGSTNIFKDLEWRDETIPQSGIRWMSVDPANKRPAFVLLLKIAILNYIELKRVSLSTVAGYLNMLLGFLKQTLEEKSILQGCAGEYLIGLNEIGTDELVPLIDQKIVLRAEVRRLPTCLNLLKDLPRHAVDGLYFLLPTFEYPWKDTSFEKWINKRYANLKEPAFEVRPYLAMPPQTTQPVIERSMWIIEEYSELILAAHREAVTMSSESYTPYLRSEAGIKFATSIKKLACSSPRNHAGFSKEGPLPFKIFLSMVNLLRAACVNIIFLTTGLRNLDLTFVRTGCCRPSGRADMLYYVDAYVNKTAIHLRLPVPEQTNHAISILEKLRWNDDSPYVIAPFGKNYRRIQELDKARVCKSTVNRWLRKFAQWFDIPFVTPYGDDDEYTAHCYRATVAGWLDSASSLSILLVRRLFGHGSNLMPLAYLHHNPIFLKARKDAIEEAASAMAKRMSKAASTGRLAGGRGEELIRGYESHRSVQNASSESMTDSELLTSFEERVRERIVSGSMLAMMTPFGVLCTRNPHDSSPPPCAIRTERDNIKQYAIDQELWRYMQAAPNPAQCVGKRCEHAMLGPWSTALRDSFYWYIGFLESRVGQPLATEELRIQARAFVKQYASDIEKIFPSKLVGE